MPKYTARGEMMIYVHSASVAAAACVIKSMEKQTEAKSADKEKSRDEEERREMKSADEKRTKEESAHKESTEEEHRGEAQR